MLSLEVWTLLSQQEAIRRIKQFCQLGLGMCLEREGLGDLTLTGKGGYVTARFFFETGRTRIEFETAGYENQVTELASDLRLMRVAETRLFRPA